jgi:hypothetical protein
MVDLPEAADSGFFDVLALAATLPAAASTLLPTGI